ncbi:MAG: ATP synthase subunit I [Desulfobacterales bacterium]
MESIRRTQKKYGSRALALAVIIGFGTVLIGQNSLGKGLILGTLFSVVNFILMGETLPLKLGRSSKKTFFISLFSMLLRYLLLAVPLVIAVKNEQFSILSAIIGVFMVQIVIVADHLGIQSPVTRKKTT